MPYSGPYSHYQAQSFAKIAERAQQAGEVGRPILLWEYALNLEIDALNDCLRQDNLDAHLVGEMYANTARFARACGHDRKAKHLEAARIKWEQENADTVAARAIAPAEKV